MKRYARIEDGLVVEVMSTDADICQLFHKDLKWVLVNNIDVTIGWRQEGDALSPPPPVPVVTAKDPSVQRSEIQTEIALLGKRVAELANQISKLPAV